MKRSAFGKLLSLKFPKNSAGVRLLSLVTRMEGGELYSGTLREVLSREYGVDVGFYSYGSLLIPGMADRHTSIGSYVSIGPGVRRFSAAHPLESLSLHPFWYNADLGYVGADNDVDRTSCRIDHDSWIGANVMVLPGCDRIGCGAVVGAGSVVTQPVPDFAVVVGSPARQIGERLDRQRQKMLLARQPWNHPPAVAQEILRSIERRFLDKEP